MVGWDTLFAVKPSWGMGGATVVRKRLMLKLWRLNQLLDEENVWLLTDECFFFHSPSSSTSCNPSHCTVVKHCSGRKLHNGAPSVEGQWWSKGTMLLGKLNVNKNQPAGLFQIFWQGPTDNLKTSLTWLCYTGPLPVQDVKVLRARPVQDTNGENEAALHTPDNSQFIAVGLSWTLTVTCRMNPQLSAGSIVKIATERRWDKVQILPRSM